MCVSIDRVEGVTVLTRGHRRDGYSILALLVFLLVAFFVIWPLRIPVPLPPLHPRLPRRIRLALDLNTAPVSGVLLLLVTRTIGAHELRSGIIGGGETHAKPYDVLALFISLAYISISLDTTGVLRFLAFWVARRGGTSGRKLYLYLYLFFFCLAAFVGNDPIILSGTAFLAYFTRVTGITPPSAWIFSQFAAANLASAILPPSNPTNLVLTSTFSLSFLTYALYLLIPTLLTSLVVYPTLLFVFTLRRPPASPIFSGADAHARYIPLALEHPPDVTPRAALLDPVGAIFGSVLLACTLIVLVVCSVVVGEDMDVCWVTLPAAGIMLVRDLWWDWKGSGKGGSDTDAAEEAEQQQADGHDVVEARAHVGAPVELNALPPASCSPSRISSVSAKSSRQSSPRRILAPFLRLPALFPTTAHVLASLPYPLLPFAFSLFILVSSLNTHGWIGIFASWAGKIIGGSDVRAVFLTGLFGVMLCNGITNIGCTLLLSQILLHPSFLSPASGPSNDSQRITCGAAFALAFASNVGAYSFTFSASLAGLLWRRILRQKGISVGRREWVGWNAPVLAVSLGVGLAVVLAEVRIMFPAA